jgi:hypothetical protein
MHSAIKTIDIDYHYKLLRNPGTSEYNIFVDIVE